MEEADFGDEGFKEAAAKAADLQYKQDGYIENIGDSPSNEEVESKINEIINRLNEITEQLKE